MHFFSAGHSLRLQCGRWNVLTFYFIPFYFLLTSFSLFAYCRSQVSDWDQDVKAALQSAALILFSALKRKNKKWLSPISFVKRPLRNERCPQRPPPIHPPTPTTLFFFPPKDTWAHAAWQAAWTRERGRKKAAFIRCMMSPRTNGWLCQLPYWNQRRQHEGYHDNRGSWGQTRSGMVRNIPRPPKAPICIVFSLFECDQTNQKPLRGKRRSCSCFVLCSGHVGKSINSTSVRSYYLLRELTSHYGVFRCNW